VKKSEIRKKILKIRKSNYSKKIKIDFKSLLKIFKKEKIKGKIIGGYYPYNYEIDLIEILEILENKNYIISLPKIRRKYQMDFFKWSTNDPLAINSLGIPEPLSKDIIYPNIILVPLVAFDKNLNRVGYGGGFYDRYIKKIKKINKVIVIGLAYSFQKVKKISIDKNDMKLDYVVTEKN